ncbi:MAG: hypothetical protein ACI9X8_000529, partial [Pseudoalteromonas distincta]
AVDVVLLNFIKVHHQHLVTYLISLLGNQSLKSTLVEM